MFRRFLRDSATYGIATLLTKGLALAVVPVYTRILSPTDFGSIDLLTVVGSLVNLTIALEVSQGLARFFGSTRHRASRVAYASTALWFTVAAYSTALVVGLVIADVVAPSVVRGVEGGAAVRLAFLGMWAGGIFYLVQNQLRWELRPAAFALVSVVATVTGAAVSVLLVVVAEMGLMGLLLGQAIGNATGAALGVVAARRSYALQFDVSKLRGMLSFSLPLVPSGLGVFASLYVDRILIVGLMSISDVGVFGIAYRIASAMSLLMLGVQAALTPLIYSQHEDPETPGTLAQIFRYFTAAALLGSLAMTLFARTLVEVVAPDSYAGAAEAIPWLAPAFVLGGMYVLAPGLALSRRTGLIAVVNIIGATGMIALNLLLIPTFGIVGAAAADLAGSAVIFLAYLVLGQRTYPIPHNWHQLGGAVLVTLAAMVVGVNIRLSPAADTLAKLLVLVGVGCAFVLIGLAKPPQRAR